MLSMEAKEEQVCTATQILYWSVTQPLFGTDKICYAHDANNLVLSFLCAGFISFFSGNNYEIGKAIYFSF